jgi:very-short-patch-repair endonuclease
VQSKTGIKESGLSQYSLFEKREFARKMRNEPTEAEAALWSKLRRKQLGLQFQRQRTLYGFIVDFWCPKARLVIEVDGSVHQIAEILAQDEQKEIIFAGYKIGMLRFTNDEVLNSITTVLRDIRRECDYLMQLQTPLRGVAFDFRGSMGKKKFPPSSSRSSEGSLRNVVEFARNSRTRGPLPGIARVCKTSDITFEIGEFLRKSNRFPPELMRVSARRWQQKQALSHWLEQKRRNQSA